jgi:metal-sulfur cluster biosynthetic enzyme
MAAPGDGPATSRAIVEALRTVHDPCCREKGISVVDMGLIESVDVEEGGATVRLVLTSGWCPFAVDLLSQVRERIESLDGIDGVVVEILWDRAWSPERLAPEARGKLRFLPDPREVPDPAAYLAAHRPRAAEDQRGGKSA